MLGDLLKLTEGDNPLPVKTKALLATSCKVRHENSFDFVSNFASLLSVKHSNLLFVCNLAGLVRGNTGALTKFTELNGYNSCLICASSSDMKLRCKVCLFDGL